MPVHDIRERLTQQQLCDRLDLSERQIRNLSALGMPRLGARGGRERHGLYPWPRVLHWYVAFKVQEGRARMLAYAERRRRTLARHNAVRRARPSRVPSRQSTSPLPSE